MPLGIWFWIGMFLWLVLGFYSHIRAAPNGPNWGLLGGNLLLFLLMALLGWKVFGSAIHG